MSIYPSSQNAVVVLVLGALWGVPAWAYLPGIPRIVNVREAPYSTVADGIADDGPALQEALDDVGATGGGQVFLPAGTYRVAKHLTVPSNTALVGIFRGPNKSVRDAIPYPLPAGTVLLAEEGANASGFPAFITITGYNTTVEGLAVFYPNQVTTDPPIAYPYTIALGPWKDEFPQTFGAENATILNVGLLNSYRGIDLSNPSARHYVKGVYGQPLLRGILVDQTWDMGRIEDVHFNFNWSQTAGTVAFQLREGVAFEFRRNDGEFVNNVFVHGYNVGMRFRTTLGLSGSGEGTTAQMSNIYLEECSIGLDVHDTQLHGIVFTNFAYATTAVPDTRIGVWGRAGKDGHLHLNGARFWGPMERAILWDQPAGTLTVSSAQVLDWSADKPAIQIRAGKAMIQEVMFLPQAVAKVAIRNDSPAPVIVSGNMLNGSTLKMLGAQQLATANLP